MKTVVDIIELFGGLDALKQKHIHLENRGYMPLVIECIGEGPSGYPLISVAHTYIQEGDVMYDPEMTFEVNWELRHTADAWGPITYRQDGLGLNQTAKWRDEDGKVYVKPDLVRSLRAFARTWNKNLREQGFITAARTTCNAEFIERAEARAAAASAPRQAHACAPVATPAVPPAPRQVQVRARRTVADITWDD